MLPRATQRILSLGPSLLNQYAARAAKVEHNLAIGQLSEPPPDEVVEAVGLALKGPQHSRYMPAAGSLEAREIVARTFAEVGIEATPERCIISNGAKTLVDVALRVLLEPGDPWTGGSGDYVVWFSPGYPPFERGAHINCYQTVAVECAPPMFAPDLRSLEEWLQVATSATRTVAVVVNNPVNPTGQVWSRKELEAVAKLVGRFGAWILADETYAEFDYEGRFVPFATLPGMAGCTVTVRSGSKELRVPSYRLGYATGPAEIIKAMGIITGECVGCPSFVSAAAAACLMDRREHCREVIGELEKRRRMVIDWADRLGLPMAPPEGGFFAFINVGPRLPEGMTTCQFADRLLGRGVGVIPGEAFAPHDRPGILSGWLRLSYAGPESTVREGLGLIAAAISELSGGLGLKP